jgi:hypothetical protein
MMELDERRRRHLATGLKTGRPPKFNILTDDYSEIAEHISSRIARNGRMLEVAVRGCGRVVIDPPCQGISSDAAEMVGTYTRGALVEHIEDDLIERLRELKAA